jgi:hypothetical protein
MQAGFFGCRECSVLQFNSQGQAACPTAPVKGVLPCLDYEVRAVTTYPRAKVEPEPNARLLDRVSTQAQAHFCTHVFYVDSPRHHRTIDQVTIYESENQLPRDCDSEESAYVDNDERCIKPAFLATESRTARGK